MSIICCKLINVTLPQEIVKNVSGVLLLDVLMCCFVAVSTALPRLHRLLEKIWSYFSHQHMGCRTGMIWCQSARKWSLNKVVNSGKQSTAVLHNTLAQQSTT